MITEIKNVDDLNYVYSVMTGIGLLNCDNVSVKVIEDVKNLFFELFIIERKLYRYAKDVKPLEYNMKVILLDKLKSKKMVSRKDFYLGDVRKYYKLLKDVTVTKISPLLKMLLETKMEDISDNLNVALMIEGVVPLESFPNNCIFPKEFDNIYKPIIP